MLIFSFALWLLITDLLIVMTLNYMSAVWLHLNAYLFGNISVYKQSQVLQATLRLPPVPRSIPKGSLTVILIFPGFFYMHFCE